MGLLSGKRLLITGVLTDASLAFAVAERSIAEGAEVVLTGAGRGLSLTRRTARKLESQPEVLEFDVTSDEQAKELNAWLEKNWGEVDGALHAIGFAPEACLGEDFMSATWDDVKVAIEISAYSFKTLAEVVSPLMPKGGSIVGLDFDARFAWPAYNWMGVAKAALEASVRYLAVDLGGNKIRVNALSAGPIKTLAASGIGDFRYILKWNEYNSPLKRTVTIEEVGDSALYLLSDLSRGVTGEVHHVDSGYHVVGMKAVDAPDISTV